MVFSEFIRKKLAALDAKIREARTDAIHAARLGAYRAEFRRLEKAEIAAARALEADRKRLERERLVAADEARHLRTYAALERELRFVAERGATQHPLEAPAEDQAFCFHQGCRFGGTGSARDL